MSTFNYTKSLLLSAFILALNAGCGTPSETPQSSSTAPTQQTITADAAPTVSTSPQVGATDAPVVPPASSTTNTTVLPQPTTRNSATPASPRSTASEPTRREPQSNKNTAPITAGANDFYLFTGVRAAIANDAELKTANVVADVREGIVTLSGTLNDPKLKSRAEDLARGVQGVKTVNSSKLRVVAATRQ